MKAPSSAAILARIAKQRRGGRVTTALLRNQGELNARALADAAAQAQGFRALGSGWVEIDRLQALFVATCLMHRDLAYGGTMMPQPNAERLAEKLLAILSEPVVYFTNGTWAHSLSYDGSWRRGGRWSGITDATLDAGIVGVANKKTLLFWVEDED